jgi:chromosome segregation ATPase
LENLSIQSASDLNPAVAQGDPATKDIEDAEQVAQTLREKIAALQTNLKEAEETVRRQDNEIKNLTANVDVLVGQIRKLAQRAKPVEVEAKIKTDDGGQLAESPNTKIVDLEARITEIQQILRHRESTIEALEKTLSVKIRDFETQLRNKEKLLLDRDKKVNDLESELTTVINRMKEISWSLRQAEALASLQQELGAAAAGQANGDKESARSNGPNNAAAATGHGTVPVELFDRMARELTSVMGPLAPAIIHYDVVALGESMEAFPPQRLAELLDTVTREIADETLKRTFRERFIRKS